LYTIAKAYPIISIIYIQRNPHPRMPIHIVDQLVSQNPYGIIPLYMNEEKKEIKPATNTTKKSGNIKKS